MSIPESDVKRMIAEALADGLKLQAQAFQVQIDSLSLRSAKPSPVTSSTSSSLKMSEMIGDFNTTARTDFEIGASTSSLLSKYDRENLYGTDRAKTQAYFRKGVPSKDLHFKALSSSSELKNMMSLDNLVSVGSQQTALRDHIYSISAQGVFYILKFKTTIDTTTGTETILLVDVDTPDGTPTDLLDCTELPELEDVITSCKHYIAYGSDFQVENLKWTYDAILNSCDKALRVILQSKMLKCPELKFGPIVFWFLIQQLTSADDSTIRAVTEEMTKINIADTPGQSITAAVAQIRAAINWLERVNMVPKDIVPIIKDIMGTCNVPSFMSYFSALITNAKLNKVKFTHGDLLSIVEEEYASLVRQGDYDLSTKGGSSFHGSSQPDVKRADPKESGHDGGRSRGVRYNTPPWVKTEPTESEPKSREFEGRIYKYCGTCGRWLYGDRGHFTEEHIVGGPKGRGKKGANAAAADTEDKTSETNESEGSRSEELGLQRDSLFFAAGF